LNRSERMLEWRRVVGLRIASAALVALVASAAVESQAAGTASDGPGDAAAWTTGIKIAVGSSADTTSKVWFTAAKGITTEVFYPRLDVPNMQDMQYIVTDGSTFVDLERDATNHVVSMPDEKALEYTVTNTDKRAILKYKIKNTYVTDPSRNTLLIRTRFQSLMAKPTSCTCSRTPPWLAAGPTTTPGGTRRTRRSSPAGQKASWVRR
jgi:glucoamylase